MSKKIKIGQIGVCHEHAAGKIIALRGMPEVFEIVGVVNDRASTAAKFAGNDLSPYDGLPFCREDALFEIPGLQAVMVETPNRDLVSTAMRCMEHNLAIHMDKPGGESLEPFVRLRRGCAERGLPFQMGYMFRGNPAMQWCIAALERGWLGDIFEIQGSMSHHYGGPAYQAYLGEFAGGIQYNLGCHLIDWVVSMLGMPERVVPFLKSAPGFPDTIKNNCLSILEYPHATVTLRACSLDAGGLSQRRLRVCGTKGTVDLCPLERFDGQPLQLRLTLLEANEAYAAGTHSVDFGVIHDRYQAQLLELADILNGETQHPCNAEHDIQVQKVLLAAAGYAHWPVPA